MYLHLKKILAFILLLGLNFTILHAQFAINGTNTIVADNNFTSNIARTGSIGIGATNPLPNDIKLFVRGRFSQEFAGTIGLTSAGNKWASLGDSFTPASGNIPSIYGLLRQSGTAGYISGVKDNAHGVAAWSGSGRMDFDWIDGSFNNQTRMSILTNGNVGIGRTNPVQKLHLDLGNNRDGIRIESGGSATVYSDLMFKVKDYSTVSTNDAVFWNISHRKDGYFTGANVGPSLEFYGAIKSSTVGSAYYAPLGFKSNGDVILASNLRAFSGKVGIGKTNPQYKLDVNGTTACTGGFWSASDKRFKKEIKDLETPNEKINQLNGVTYKFKKEKFGEIDFTDTEERTEYGFLAQDLKKVFPELVREDEDGYFAVRYEGLIPVLVEAVKDQNVTIDEQAKDIADQAATIEQQAEEIETLNARMNQLESMMKNLATTSQVGSKTDNTIIQNTAILKQNTPNPFNNNTMIQYELPSNVGNASLVIYDVSGKSLQSFSITGKGSVEFDASGLENGTYIYSILSNGESIARQKMVVQK